MNTTNFVGLFPAGGVARRLGLKSSKEILPVINETGGMSPVGDYLLEAYKAADITEIYVILRKEKQDIVDTFADGYDKGLSIAYLPLRRPWGTPFTLDQAWPFIKDKPVALGFPDIILRPNTAFIALKNKLMSGSEDVILGLFKTNKPQKADMVVCDENGKVLRLDIKPSHSALSYTWVIAVWRPTFTAFMHEYLKAQESLFLQDPSHPEPFVGTVINAALENGLTIGSTIIKDGVMLDVGTPDDLELARSSQFFQIEQ